MTTEYQNLLEDCLVNNLEITEPEPKVTFDETIVQDTSAWNEVLPANISSIYYKGSINDNVSNKIILYGYYMQNGTSKGIITILDESFNPIKSFFTYNNGVTLNPIQCMEQAEDGTYYFIDKATRLRLVMVNNFSIQKSNGEYVLIFRKSYNFDSAFDDYTVNEMYKSGTSSDYLFFSDFGSNIKVTELKINVGSTNEWNTIDITNNYFGGSYALFNSDGVFWRLLVTTSDNKVICYTKNYTATTPTQTIINTFSFVPTIQSDEKGQCVFVDQNTIYFTLHQVSQLQQIRRDFYIGLYKYSFTDNSFKTLYYKNLENEQYGEKITLSVSNSVVYIEYDTQIVRTSGKYYSDYYFQRLIDDVWSPILYETNKYFTSNNLLISKTDFNLLQLCSFRLLLSDKYILLFKDDYNILNYNGFSYTNYNSIIPKKVELYANDSLIFARNIIDKTIIENKTISNAIVPNTYLNNMYLGEQCLLSETNTNLIKGTVPLRKNIYESLYLNFINTIKSVVFYSDNASLYLSGEIPEGLNSYVNQNVNVATKENMENTSMGSVVIYYSDGTNIVNSTNWEKSGDAYKLDFALDVQKEISSYEIKSTDLEQTYLHVDVTNLEIGNIYKITQYFFVEGR